MKDRRLRTVFDEIADLYDRVRPNYPEELFDALVQTTTIDANSKLLEIAPGTGQATLSLAKRRFNITAIELGSRMSAIARIHLRDYGAVQVITGAFEDVDLPDNSFDLVYVATAFHWISPDAQFQKPHRILKSNGYLAIILGSHISGGDNRFFEATQPLYRKFMPQPPGTPPYALKRLEDIVPAELDEALFQLVWFSCFPRTISYSAEEYCSLLNTESEKLALPPDARTAFLNEMAELIKRRFNGIVTERYANALTIAKRV